MGALIGGRWRALLLDLDGTLVDSEPSHQAAFRDYFASRGWDVDPELRRHFIGRRGSDVFATMPGPWAGEDPDALVAEVISHLDHEADPPEPIPGASNYIRGVHAKGVPIALVTSATRTWAEYAVGEILGVRECFAALVTWEDVTAGKPDPAPYRAGAQALHVDPAQAMAVEDTDAGVRSALAAGIGRVVGVTTTIDAAALQQAGAHRVVTSIGELTT